MVVDAQTAPRILIIRRDNIGDLVCTTPLIGALRAQFPRAWLGAVVTTYNADVLAGNPALNEIFVHEKLKHRSGGLLSHLRRRFAESARLRARKIDCVLVPAASPQALKLARSLKPGRLLAASTVARARQHEVERTYDIGRALGLVGKPGPLDVRPDPQSKAALQSALGPGPIVAIHISARRPAQRWPLQCYAALAAELAKEARVMLLWAPGGAANPRHPGDDDAAAKVLRLSGNANVLPVATADLKTLIAALSLAGRVVCPDGGAMHLAAALGKPVLALFGDSPVERWRPWGVPHRVVRPDSRNLADLSLPIVLAAYRELAGTGEAEHQN